MSGEARYPRLLDRCIFIMIAHQKGCPTVSKNSQKYFPSTFRRDIRRKFVIPLNCISFGIQIPSARHHSCGTIPIFQACWRRTASFLRTRGQFLYNLYYIPFKPGELTARASWTKSWTSFSFIPLLSNITLGSWGFGKSLRGGIGIPFKSFEYVFLKWFSSSSFGTLSLPLFDSTKSFFCESIRIWVEWSSSLTLFLSMFSRSFSSGDHQNPFLNIIKDILKSRPLMTRGFF